MKFPSRIEKWVPCSHCHSPLPYGSVFFRLYFESENMACSACKREIDGFECVHQWASQDFFDSVAVMAGAEQTLYKFELKPDETVSLSWTEVGIPEDAVVVSANVTPQGIDLPAPSFLFGNTINNRPLSSPQIHIYGASWAKLRQPGPASLMVTWVPRSCGAERLLLSSAVQFQNKEYDTATITACAAAELALVPAVRHAIKIAQLDELEPMTKRYSNCLRLMALVGRITSQPPLGEAVVKKLDALRRSRNQVLHAGRHRGRDSTLRGIVAAIFGVQYARLIGSEGV